MTTAPILITLDRERAIRWTKRAEARNSSLRRRAVKFTDLSASRSRFWAMCAILWSSLVGNDHEFETPEDIAEFLATEDQQLAAVKAIRALIDDAFPEKKTQPNGDSSRNGQTPLSSLESVQHASTTGS